MPICNDSYFISHYKIDLERKHSHNYLVLTHMKRDHPSPLPMNLSEYKTDSCGKYIIVLSTYFWIGVAMASRPPTKNDAYSYIIKSKPTAYSMIEHPTEEHTTLQKLLWEV